MLRGCVVLLTEKIHAEALLPGYLQDRGTPIGPLDMLIAAHARSEDMILVTNNVREFERVPDLVVENWIE